MRYQVLRRFRCRYGPNSGDELFDTSGRYSIAGTIRGGNGGRATFERFGGARELPLLADSCPTDDPAVITTNGGHAYAALLFAWRKNQHRNERACQHQCHGSYAIPCGLSRGKLSRNP